MKHVSRITRATGVAVLLTGLVGLTACSAPQPTSPSTSTTAAAGASSAALYADAKKVGTVTVYGPFQSTYAPLYAEFTKAYPGVVVKTADLSGPQLQSTLQAEIASSTIHADVVATGPIDVTRFAASGWIENNTPADAAGLDKTYIGSGGSYVAPVAAEAIFAYNTKLASKADLPTSWEGLLSGPLSSQLVVGDPTVPGLSAQAFGAALKHGAITDAYLKSLKGVVTVQSNTAQALQALSTGQKAIGISMPYDLVQHAKGSGAPIDSFVLAKGNPVIPTAYALIAGSPNPAGGKLLQNWLLSKDGQAGFAAMNLQGTAPGAPAPKNGLPALAKIDPIVADLSGQELTAALTKFGTIFGTK